MKPVHLITTNEKKYQTAREIFNQYWVSLLRESFDTPEVQSFDVSEIACFSAKYVADKLSKSVIVTDVWYYIESLSWFPWPYIKQMNTWFSSEHILKLMDWEENRNLKMIECAAYCEPWSEPVPFITTSYWVIAKKAEWEWTTLDTILIREGHDKVQSLYTFEEQIAYYVSHLDHYHQFCQFYVKQ